ncbi:hypothetical protein KIH39_23780 [Telmatocola sphagniphila]|uniref:Uncharacterized protein n=1 Tax=Telmatocola sphagniphila TaxID=1123043 RepID=A0A8E6B619_9BACT|nr:hypothetical protein [Telmatocola sphagniphila]QVL31821.1 hypothetical protein KIH39_23780 [Telmatocola sphagniphila]
MFNFFRLGVLPAVVGLAVSAGGTVAQQPFDGENKAKAMESLIYQKAESDILKTIEESNQLKERSEARATQLLRNKISAIKDEPSLGAKDRAKLIAKLETQIRVIENKDPAKNLVNSEELTNRKLKEEERAKAILAEIKDVRRELDTIKALFDSQKFDQARKQADALLKKFPDNPSSIALSNTTLNADAINEARIVSGQMREGYRLAMLAVDKSATMPKDDITFDVKYTREVVSKRNKPTLTQREVKILKSLEIESSFEFKDEPLEKVLNDLSKQMNTSIILDEVAKQELKIDSNTFVNASLKNVTTRSALRKILADKGLAFVMKNESIYVTTNEKAKDMLVSRVYYVGDLVSGLGPFNAIRAGNLADVRQTQEMVDQLMRAILSVDPNSWERNNNGGHGTVTFHWPSLSFVVRQSAEVHAKLSGSFGSGIK